jgi:hypothetical protein
MRIIIKWHRLISTTTTITTIRRHHRHRNRLSNTTITHRPTTTTAATASSISSIGIRKRFLCRPPQSPLILIIILFRNINITTLLINSI